MLRVGRDAHHHEGPHRGHDRNRAGLNPGANIHLFGEEVNPETYAVCKSDLYITAPEAATQRTSLSEAPYQTTATRGQRFDYLIANPPYGKDWKRDEKAVRSENERGAAGRFGPGLPRISDGQLLFLLHMLAHAKGPKEGGARIAIIMNGSPLFTGDAGSGESEIRRFVMEHDLLEALVALPEELFYNTGIATYVWVITNRKAAARKGQVQLIDASSQAFWMLMRKNMGAKRREIPPEKARDILELLAGFKDGDTRRASKDGEEEAITVSRIFPTTNFGFRKITVERPLRLNFQASPERIARLDEEKGFQGLVQSKKKGAAGAREEAQGRELQEALKQLLNGLPATLVKDRNEFEHVLDGAATLTGIKIPAQARKAILSALSERDEAAAICRDRDGNPESDPELRDSESVPLPPGDDPADTEGVPASVRAFFDQEVRPHVPDAWIDTGRRDDKDGLVGVVGYEINFNRHFYRYKLPRPVEEIEADIRTIEGDIVRMLAEVTGSNSPLTQNVGIHIIYADISC